MRKKILAKKIWPQSPRFAYFPPFPPIFPIFEAVYIIILMFSHFYPWLPVLLNSWNRSFTVHFADNDKRAPKDHPNYDPLFKLRKMFNTIMDGIRKAWSARMNITIDESKLGSVHAGERWNPSSTASKSLLRVVLTQVYCLHMMYIVAKTLMVGIYFR